MGFVSDAVSSMATIGLGSVGDVAGQITGASQAADAAKEAAATQAKAAQAGIDAQTAARLRMEELLSPYTQAGPGALSAQQDLIGLNGPEAQAAAIAQLQSSPAYTSQVQSGTNAILQNASATGGLRGGNTQGALAQFEPALLTQLIQQQYGNLGGLTRLGQNSAAGVGESGTQTANSIAQLLQQQGAAVAGGQVAQGGVQSSVFNTALQLAGMFAGAGGFGGGGKPAATPGRL